VKINGLGRPTVVAVGVVLGLLVPAILYYVLSYRPTRQRYFTESTFRALGVLAEQVAGAVASRSTAVRNAATGSVESQQESALRLANLEKVKDCQCVPKPNGESDGAAHRPPRSRRRPT